MKILVIGDIHCRTIWKDIVDKETDCDKIVFLGDYTVPRDVKLNDPTDACGTLYNILDFKDKNPDKVVLLRGNHDLCSLGYYWAECWPQDYPKVEQYWRTNDVKNWFLKNTQWVYIIPNTNIVCSHAGIGIKFLDACTGYFDDSMYNDKSSDLEVINLINTIEPCELFGFTPDKLSDNTGESSTQPCTWIRPYTLMQYGVKDIIHVVGHTPTKHICNLKDECKLARKKYSIDENEEIIQNYCDVWCCDNLANGEYLIIEDGEFKPCKL